VFTFAGEAFRVGEQRARACGGHIIEDRIGLILELGDLGVFGFVVVDIVGLGLDSR
jgi:hypothetical protein